MAASTEVSARAQALVPKYLVFAIVCPGQSQAPTVDTAYIQQLRQRSLLLSFCHGARGRPPPTFAWNLNLLFTWIPSSYRSCL
jgi:hypothetical protein